jgi:phage terminase small subunit
MPILKNPKHEHFAQAYVLCNNLGRAAREAGYAANGDRQRGYALSKDKKIAARIKELRDAYFDAMQMENAEILARLAAAARTDIRQLYAENGAFKAMADLTFDEAAMITSVEADEEVGKDGTVKTIIRKVKVRDPVPALRILAQHKKLIGTELEEGLNNIASAFADRMAAARQRRRTQEGK